MINDIFKNSASGYGGGEPKRDTTNSVSKSSASGSEPKTESIYGVYGLTEWEIVIPAGASKVRIRFDGGSMSSLGVVPATYSTSSRAVKRIIENSPQFRERRIVKLTKY